MLLPLLGMLRSIGSTRTYLYTALMLVRTTIPALRGAAGAPTVQVSFRFNDSIITCSTTIGKYEPGLFSLSFGLPFMLAMIDVHYFPVGPRPKYSYFATAWHEL